MSRAYSVPLTGIALNTTAPFLQLATSATSGIEILRIELNQESLTTSTQMAVTLMRRSTASTLPTTAAPVALVETGPTALETGTTTTCAIGIASVTGTAGNTLMRWGFNILSGLLYLPVPEERITVKPSSFITLQFPVAPSSSVTWDGQVVFSELS